MPNGRPEADGDAEVCETIQNGLVQLPGRATAIHRPKEDPLHPVERPGLA